ncbi:MAG TPA: Asp-tRNA(Asn)/Glu-tRNA(Gln) amidotransferase subunit GatB [Patescibacteria group bacterium]
MSKYHLVCGLEVHAELKTASKMFCGCKNDPFHAPQPNIYTCPVCLGMPGGLPVANKKAIDWTLKLGLALNCKINLFSKFDRKHYFYPDLPKGYQISQYDIPFCYDGDIETSEGKVRIRRIHLEEDTGKLLHQTLDGEKVSLVDFNRSGVPLIEIVTEPDIKTASQAKEYGKKLRDLIRYLDIGDCDMEQGGMRLEANISLRSESTDELPNYKVEVKNINSFRFLEQAIAYETERQSEILNQNQTPAQETRGFNPTIGQTFAQRTKEEAEDYRYFPDPDIPPLHFTKVEIKEIENTLPELPHQVIERWRAEYQIDPRFAEPFTNYQVMVEWTELILKRATEKKIEANKLLSDIINKKIDAEIGRSIEDILTDFVRLHQTAEVDTTEIETIIDQVKAEHPDEVTRYQNGEVQLLNFFIGQTMRKLGKKVDMNLIRTALQKALNS